VSTVNGLPFHMLLVHALVVLVPIAAGCVAASTLWVSWRRRLGEIPLVLSALVVVLTPLSTSAGEWLQEHVPDTERVRRHAELGDQLLPWLIGLLVVAVLAELVRREHARVRRLAAGGPRTALRVVACLVALGCLVTVVRIGDSGAQAVWHGKTSSTSSGG
jgi:hypothetical protein